MTQTLEMPRQAVSTPTPVQDQPQRRRSIPRSTLIEVGGSVIASVVLVWLAFTVGGVTGPLGFGVCCLAGFFIIYALLCWRLHGVLAMKDRLATVTIWSGALIAFVPLIGVIAYVCFKGIPVVWASFPSFLIKDFSRYTGDGPVTSVGAGAAIVGTVEQVALATIFTVPLGVLTATYIVNSRHWFSGLVSTVVDAMTGAPAIIPGLFVYLLWVRPQKETGQTGFAAALALAVMMLPIVTRASQEVIAIVPPSLNEAALALGAPRWRSILRVTLPTARVGLVTAVILGVARVAGETAPILFNAGGNQDYNWNPFVGRQDDLPFRIYELIFQPGTNPTREAWGISFVLVMVVVALFVLARVVGSKKPGQSRFPSPLRMIRRSGGSDVS
jgi:phosphate transport system permease protein